MKVLVADKLPEEALCVLADAGMDVASKSGLSEKELCAQISDADGVIVRSATQVTAKALACAGRLKVICRAGVGVDNVDVPTATKRGVLVMNTPGGNTLSTAEHTMALLLAMSRNVAPAAQSMKEHRWDKKLFKGTQLAGKTLGVIGLGRVGAIVADRAVGMRMEVLVYDPFVTQEAAAALGRQSAHWLRANQTWGHSARVLLDLIERYR